MPAHIRLFIFTILVQQTSQGVVLMSRNLRNMGKYDFRTTLFVDGARGIHSIAVALEQLWSTFLSQNLFCSGML